MDVKHKDALRELEIAALRGHPDGYATGDCTVTYKEAADALRAALARIDELETALGDLLVAEGDNRYSDDGQTLFELLDKVAAARALLQPAGTGGDRCD